MAGACACLFEGAGILTAVPALADGTDDYTALILGHAFLSQPDTKYMDEVIGTYINPSPAYFTGQPTYGIAGNPVSVYTPESNYQSGLTEGVGDLDKAISGQLETNPNADLAVFGYSMSTSIETQEMIKLAGETNPPDQSGLTFILAEDLNNPDGGIFTRFPAMFGVNLPATPADTPYTTDIYTIEYSGASDFPQYYGNLFADANAAAGYFDLHPYLLEGWPAYFTPGELSGTVQDLNVSSVDVNTDYFTIPTQQLPLLDGLHTVGGTSFFSDLIQPDMRVLVDLGYNWTGDADVSTAATLTNPDIDFTAVDSYLAAGADQGIIAALVDLGLLPQSDLSDLYPYVPDVAGLEAGALTSDTLAATDASASYAALVADLADSTNPLVADLGALLPSVGTGMADFFQSLASLL